MAWKNLKQRSLADALIVEHAVYSNKNTASAQEINFNNVSYLDYVPIHVTGTRVVEQKLPPGAAAVLINQNHTYTDLYLVISEDEKQWFDAIDGKRSIRQIIKKDSLNELAHHFFECLWLYDQIVFDASLKN